MVTSTSQEVTAVWNFEDFFDHIDSLLEAISQNDLTISSHPTRSDEECRALFLKQLRQIAERRNSRYHSPFEELGKLQVRFEGEAQLVALAEGLCSGQALRVLRDASRGE